MFDELLGPAVTVVLAVAGTAWYFKGALEKVLEKVSGIEEDLKSHAGEERVENVKGDVLHQSLINDIKRIENKIDELLRSNRIKNEAG